MMNTLFGHFKILHGHTGLLVAVSGGLDSMVLLYALQAWCMATPNAPPLYAATVNHHLREGAQAEAKMVAAYCVQLGVPHTILHWHHEEKPTARLMEQARAARYALLAQHAHECGADIVVSAHHADDQAETFVMRLLRGSGLTGLSAMHSLRHLSGDVLLARPFLSVAKKQLRAIALEQNIPYVEDPSNDDTNFERVRVRDAIKSMAFGESHLSLALQRLQRAEHALQDVTASFMAHCVHEGDAVKLQRALFDYAPEDVQIRILAQLLHDNATEYPLSLAALERLHHELLYDEGTTIRRTLGGYVVSLSSKWLKVAREGSRQKLSKL